jgi:polysaccharide pyruvyl transferase WcaK-like protein
MSRPAPVIRGIERPGDLMAMAGRMDLLIGMRLHALIFGAALGVPLAGLSYDPKVDALLAQLGGAGPQEVSELDTDALVNAFASAWEERAPEAARLKAAAARLRETALDTARHAGAFLERTGA